MRLIKKHTKTFERKNRGTSPPLLLAYDYHTDSDIIQSKGQRMTIKGSFEALKGSNIAIKGSNDF